MAISVASSNNSSGSPPAVYETASSSPAVERSRIESPKVVPRPARPAPQPSGLGLTAKALRDPVANMVRVNLQEWEQQSLPLADGTPRIVGESQGLLLELTGPPSNLDSASLMLIIDPNDPANLRALVIASRAFLEAAFPDWSGREYFIRHMSTETPGNYQGARRQVTKTAQTVGGNRVVMLSLEPRRRPN